MNRKQINLYRKEASQGDPKWGTKHFWKWNNFYCHWRILGNEENPPLLLLHGFGASSSHWRNNAQYFAEKGFAVYGLDLIGFGKSEQPGPKKLKKLDNHFWSMQVTAFLQDIVNAHKDRKVVILGNSLGGLTAITTASFSPHLIKAVIAAPLPDPVLNQGSKSISPRWLRTIQNNLISIFFKILPLELLIPLIVKTKLINLALQAAYFKSVQNDLDLKSIVTLPAQRNSASRALRAMCIGMATRTIDCTAPYLLKRINSFKSKIPILLAWGKEDKFVPLIIGNRLISQYPSLELLVIKNSGHCPHDESPIEFNQSVLHWLKNNLKENK